MYNELETKAESSQNRPDANSSTADAFRSELYTQTAAERSRDPITGSQSDRQPAANSSEQHLAHLEITDANSDSRDTSGDVHSSKDAKDSTDGAKDTSNSAKDTDESKDSPLSTDAISPGDLDDPAKLAQILVDAKAAHEAWERENESEMAWSDFYTNYINDRLRAGGHEPLDGVASARLSQIFTDAGKAHHQFEIDTGEEDKDWPGWYANYIIKARQAG